MITVDEVMTRDLYTLKMTDSVADARNLMVKVNIRHIPVVDEFGKLAGLVSQRDLLAAADSVLSDLTEQQRVSVESHVNIVDVMTTDVAVIDEHTSLRSAALYLQSHKYGCLPVMSDGALSGIVTETDFVEVAVNLLEQIEFSEPEEPL
jgi:CBS domain-containing protein